MLTINRGCSYRIITRAVRQNSQPLIGLLQPDDSDCIYSLDEIELTTALAANREQILVYNQHPEALALVWRLNLTDGQILIEIRQDTKGVLGLHALRHRAGGTETLELTYQE